MNLFASYICLFLFSHSWSLVCSQAELDNQNFFWMAIVWIYLFLAFIMSMLFAILKKVLWVQMWYCWYTCEFWKIIDRLNSLKFCRWWNTIGASMDSLSHIACIQPIFQQSCSFKIGLHSQRSHLKLREVCILHVSYICHVSLMCNISPRDTALQRIQDISSSFVI